MALLSRPMTSSSSAGGAPSNRIVAGLKPYVEKAPLAAFFLGVSSGFPYAMIAATLTTRLAQNGIGKKTVTAFAVAFLLFLCSLAVTLVQLRLAKRSGAI